MFSPSTNQIEQIKNIVSQMVGDNKAVLSGYITSVNPNTIPVTVKVMLQPYDTESGWLPVMTPYVGPQCGLILPPPEEMTPVLVVSEMGQPSSGKVIAMQWNDQMPEPTNVTSGSMGFVHKSGTQVLIDPEGNVNITTTKTVNLGGANGKGVAYVGCEVAVTVSGTDSHGDLFTASGTGTITQGSSQVLTI